LVEPLVLKHYHWGNVMKIGVCGVGRMGAALTERLIEVGHEVMIWNRTPARCQPLQAKGAARADSPAALAAANDVTLVIVTDAAAQAAVYGGPAGIAAANLEGRLVIDMSTVPSAASKRAAEQVRTASGTFVECPVGGTVAPAKAGKLLGMAGGEVANVNRARPLLEQLCRRVEHVGPVGAGAAMKLAVNLPLAVYWEALGEALSIATTGGVSKELAADLMSDSSGAIAVMKPRIPMILDAIDGNATPAPAFDIAGMAKDLAVMQATAEANGIAAPVTAAARAAYESAQTDGWADRDAATQAAWRFRAKR
jgi:3-hydroxyisobutyrate dehydrogenase